METGVVLGVGVGVVVVVVVPHASKTSTIINSRNPIICVLRIMIVSVRVLSDF